MEVLYSVAFLRVGQSSVDATLVMPGNMSAYRGDVVRRLGFGIGFNGEDTDMAVRLGRTGLRIVTDLNVRFYPEVPATLGQLREQRQRWTRGILCVAARNGVGHRDGPGPAVPVDAAVVDRECVPESADDPRLSDRRPARADPPRCA